MAEKHNYFQEGSLNYLIVEANRVEDIIYIMWDDVNRCLKILVKPNYDIDTVLEFIDNFVPLGIYYKIIVENNYELIKKGD